MALLARTGVSELLHSMVDHALKQDSENGGKVRLIH